MRRGLIGQTFMDEIHPHRSREITDAEADKNVRLINLAGELQAFKNEIVSRASRDAHPDSLAGVVLEIVSIAGQMAETLGLTAAPTLQDDPDYPDPFENPASQE